LSGVQLGADVVLPFPRQRVFDAYRDRLLELLPYLPNIRGIEVRSRQDEPPRVHLVNIWRGGGDIPAAVRTFLSESMLSWTDHATWHGQEFTCQWRIETHAFTEAVTCAGQNRYVELDGGRSTLVELRGDLTIDARKLKGVPGFLAGTVARTAEQMLVGKIQPNLLETAAGIRRLLEAG
jgi:hypothetical protein